MTEQPAYEPSGDGDHVFAWIEKTGVTTFDAINRMAAALDIAPRDVGSAGLKDKYAVTRQYLSFPPPINPEQVLALELPGISVLEATRHRNKLKTGHLRGNHFTLRLRDTIVTEEQAADRAVAILDRLSQPPGSPNWFGPQRFGNDGQNAAIGHALLTNNPLPDSMRPPKGKRRRLFVSAFQSHLFNEYLRRRMGAGLYRCVVAGDLLAKRTSGGMFCCDDPTTDNQRLASGEIVPTGPMFGHSMRQPEPGPAAELEQHILDEHELELDDFKSLGKLAHGTRRHVAIDLGSTGVKPIGPRAIEVWFDLPAGAYATVVMREILRIEESTHGSHVLV